MELVVLIGLQRAGKTSLYRSRFAATHAHVSKDNFRHNRWLSRSQRHLIVEALGAGRSVVVDNTNPTVGNRAELVALDQRLLERAVPGGSGSDGRLLPLQPGCADAVGRL